MQSNRIQNNSASKWLALDKVESNPGVSLICRQKLIWKCVGLHGRSEAFGNSRT